MHVRIWLGYHEAEDDKILVFCDNIFCLKRHASQLNKDVYAGDKDGRTGRLLANFRQAGFLLHFQDRRRHNRSSHIGRDSNFCHGWVATLRTPRLRKDPVASRMGAKQPFLHSSADTDEVDNATKGDVSCGSGYSFKVVPSTYGLMDDDSLPLHARHEQLCVLEFGL